MAARLWFVASALATGILIASATSPPVGLALALAAVAFGMLATVRRGWVVLVAACALGCVLATTKIAAVERAALGRAARTSADAMLTGEALTDGVERRGALQLTLGVRAAVIDGEPVRVRERVLVSVRPPPRARPALGDVVRVDARLGPLTFRGMDRAGRASAQRLRDRGISARAFADPDGIEIVGRTGNPVVLGARAARAAMRAAAATVPARDRGLLLGVTIGDTSMLDAADEVDFRTTGLSHLVAVSGANVAIVLGMIALLLRVARAGRRTTVAAMTAMTMIFCATAAFEPSVMRAGAMTVIALGGLAIGARRRAGVALAAASIVLLVADPFLVRSAGFQLSVLATAGILEIAPRIRARFGEGRLHAAAAVTLGAQLAVAPLIVLNFRELSLVALAANLIVAPFVAPATVIGFAAGAGALLWRPLGAIALAAHPFLVAMRWVARALASIPFAAIGLSAGAAAALAVGFGIVALRVARGPRPVRAMARADHPASTPRARLAPLVLAVLGVFTALTWARAVPEPPARLEVVMLDVGQGEAILVRSAGKTMLIDGGPDERGLIGLLRRHGVHRLDLLVISHPHADHIDGLVPVARRWPVARALDPMIEDDLPSYRALRRALSSRGVPVDRAVAGTAYRLGSAFVEVIWPPREHLEGTPADINNNSIVLRVGDGPHTILFAGETQEEAQAELLRSRAPLSAGVLKVSHHGSRRMLPEFYRASGARIALIPVGANRFGHPAAQTLAALSGMQILRSDRHGTVRLRLDPDRPPIVHTERQAA